MLLLQAGFGFLSRYVRPQRGRVALLVVCLCSGLVLQLLSPQLIRAFIDTAQSGGPQQLLLSAALVYLAATIGQRVLEFCTVYLGEIVGWHASNALRADLALHCLRLDMGFHKRHTPGELIERVDGDVGALENFFSQFAAQLVGNSLLVLGIIVVLGLEDWRVGAGLLVYTVVVGVALFSAQRAGVARWGAYQQAEAELFGFLEERIAGTEDIRAAGAEAHTLRRLEGQGRALLRKNRAARMASNITYAATNFLYVVGYGLGLAIGAFLYLRGEASIGTAFLIVAYIGMLAAPLERIQEQVQDAQRAGAAIKRIAVIMALQPMVREQPRAALLDTFGVTFEHVSFRYEDDETPGRERNVLEDITFALAPGRVLGLLGRTGSGKTTLSRLLFRLYDPSAGAIRFGGTHIGDVALADLRARVGMVTQDVQLFHASVRDNVALFDHAIDDAQITSALDALGLGAWAGSLPQGLDTPLGADGAGLSAGEAQLLAFARVFLRNPSLIILDEASSRLDPSTEQLLEHALDRLLAGRSAIIIAHRLDTVRRADDILILEDGRVAEHGPRTLLAADESSRFAHLLRVGMGEALV